MLTGCFAWAARLSAGSSPYLISPRESPLFPSPPHPPLTPSTSAGTVASLPHWDGDPAVQLPGQDAGPLPTRAPGLELVALSQGGPAHCLLSLACRQHSGPTPGQGSDTAHIQPVPAGSGCVPIKANAETPISQEIRLELVGHSARSQGCWGQVPALPPPLCDLAQAPVIPSVKWV